MSLIDVKVKVRRPWRIQIIMSVVDLIFKAARLGFDIKRR